MADIPMDLLGGSNFIQEYDVSALMARNTIYIGEAHTVMTTSHSVLERDWLNIRQLAASTGKESVVPKNLMTFPVPEDAAPESCEILDKF